MNIINEITLNIIKNAREGESIRSLASKIGFAYSAVYKWVSALEQYGVIEIIKEGNKNTIKINKNLIYKKFKELDKAVAVIEKDKTFWNIIRNIKLRMRFVKGTAATIWTQGSFITGDFYDRIYFVEVNVSDLDDFKKVLDDYEIAHTEKEIINKRPLIYIIPKRDFKITRRNDLPTMPLRELIFWCKRLSLENILEQLNLLYNLKLKTKYAEIATNMEAK